MCIDRLRSAKAERVAYTGHWLPEPLGSVALSPDRTAELASDVSIAFLTVLERLAPEERAGLLLREVFDFEYTEIARIVRKSPSACRQIIRRAKERVHRGRPRFAVSRSTQVELLEKFMAAATSGSREEIMALLAEDVTVTADGGGKVPSFVNIPRGVAPVARLYAAFSRKFPGQFAYGLADINGEPGLLRYLDGKLESAQAFVIDGTRIRAIYVVRNPDKLKGIAPAP